MAEISFHGEAFPVPERINALAYMRYAEASVRGVDSDDMEGLAVMYVLLKSCFTEQDWHRFEALCLQHNSTHAELLEVVKQIFEAVAARPTQRPSDSSDGPASTSPSSAEDSSSQVIEDLVSQGRPDLALVVKGTQEFLAG